MNEYSQDVEDVVDDNIGNRLRPGESAPTYFPPSGGGFGGNNSGNN